METFLSGSERDWLVYTLASGVLPKYKVAPLSTMTSLKYSSGLLSCASHNEQPMAYGSKPTLSDIIYEFQGTFLDSPDVVFAAARYVLFEKLEFGFMDDLDYSCKVITWCSILLVSVAFNA